MHSPIEQVLKNLELKRKQGSVSAIIEFDHYTFFPIDIIKQTMENQSIKGSAKLGYIVMDSSRHLVRRYSGGIYRVYKAYLVDLHTKQPINNKPIAVKKIKKADFDRHGKELIEAELNHGTMSPTMVEQNDDVYLMMEYLPGTNLIDEKGCPAPEIKNLSLSDRATFILKNVVKFYNLKDENEKNFNNNVYEFLLLTILNLLGAKDPLAYKRQSKYVSEYNYNSKGLFEGFDIPDEPIDIKSRVWLFLRRMKADQPEDRPDAAEILNFAQAFYDFCQTLEMPYTGTLADFRERLTKLSEPAAKIELLAQGVWNADLGDQATAIRADNVRPAELQKNAVKQKMQNLSVEQPNQHNSAENLLQQNNIENKVPAVKPISKATFGQYDFLHNHLFNKIILVLRDYQIFDKDIIVQLAKQANTEQGLNTLYDVMQRLCNKDLLTKEILTELLQKSDLHEDLKSPLFIFSLAIKTGVRDKAWDYLDKPSLQQKLKLFKDVLVQKDSLIKNFEQEIYENTYKLIADSLINEINQYQKTLRSIDKFPFSGVCFWRTNIFNRYTFKHEIDVYEKLKNAIKKDDFSEFNAQSNNIDVLKKGIIPCDFRKCVEECVRLTKSAYAPLEPEPYNASYSAL